MNNYLIAQIFTDIADLLEIKGDNPFRIRAYRNASRTIINLSSDIETMVKNHQKIAGLPGIGKDLATKIEEIVQTGHLLFLDNLEKNFSPDLLKFLKISGLGGSRVRSIYTKLGIKTIEELRLAAQAHRISQLPGFGEKIESNIIAGISQLQSIEKSMLYSNVELVAEKLLRYLNQHSNSRYTIAGSFRRKKETINDLDILCIEAAPLNIIELLQNYSETEKILIQGETKNTVLLKDNIQVDIRIVGEKSYGAALHYFTGSKAHNIEIRRRAVKAGLKINEYGIYKENEKIGGQSESGVFDAVNLAYIEPELRENSGEIEAASSGNLPVLVTENDIKGDLHIHTNYTDGKNSLLEMVKAASDRGYAYIGITDHSKSLFLAHGLDAAIIREQSNQISLLQKEFPHIRIFKGIEVDILEDGTLDLPNEILEELDFTICSIHSKLNLSPQKQTTRILKAIQNRHFIIFGHPSSRIINRRNPIEYDYQRVFKEIALHGCILELNASPDRLDINAIHCRLARDLGIKIIINTDAHSVLDFNQLRFGIGQARRGWLEKRDVINTFELGTFENLLKRK